jgi:hypothetical protein
LALGGLGATGDAISQTASNVAGTLTGGLSNIASWFSSHWIWFALAIVAILAILAWAYGGFRFGG